MRTLIFIAIAGAAAQLVDGGLGMGFGVTSTTVLILLASLGPAQASAVVHTAEVGTTLVSGLSHWRFGNVDWKVVLRLGVPGAIGAFIGATLLANISLSAAKPVTATILTLIGVNLVWRFSRGKRSRVIKEKKYSTPFLGFLGIFGGFVDASGGGGWGPVTTSTLMSLGRQEPRRVVGTVNAAEFLVSAAATAGFAVVLWQELTQHAAAVAALLIGGMIASPIAAWLISRVNAFALGGLVGTALVVLNLPIRSPWLLIPLAIIGIALTVRGVRAARRVDLVEQVDPEPAKEAVAVSS